MNNQSIAFIILFILIVNIFFINISVKKISEINVLKKYFIRFLLVGFLWLITNFITLYFSSIFFLKISYGLGAFAYTSYLLFIISFYKENNDLKEAKLFYIIALLFFILSIIPNCLFTVKIINNDFIINTKNIFILYVLGVFFSLSLSVYKIIHCIKKFTGVLKLQAQYTLIGVSLFAFSSFCFSFILPTMGYTFFAKFDVCSYLFFAGFTFYAIIAHNLMDIDLAWRKLLKNIIFYSLFFTFAFGINFISNYYKINQTISNIIIAAIFILYFYYSKPFNNYLYNMLLGDYKKVWTKLKNDTKIKTDVFENTTVFNVIILDIPKILNLTYSAYYEVVSDNTYKLISTNNIANNENQKNKILSLDNKIITALLDTKSFLYLENIKKDISQNELMKEMENLDLVLCYPFFNKNKMVGVLVYGTKIENKIFHSEDLEILNDIIKAAEKQINNITKVKNFSIDVLDQYKKTNQLVLFEEVKKLGNFRQLDELCEQSEKLINRLLNSSKTNIYLLNEDTKIFYSATNNNLQHILEESFFAKYLIQVKEMILAININRWATETKSKEFINIHETIQILEAKVVIPFISTERLLGFITINNKADKEQEYSEDDFLMLNFICDKIKTTLESIYANQQANIDSLTKLSNHRFLTSSLEDEITKSFQDGRAISIAIFDLDNFKGINDKFGHDAGDNALITVSKVMKSLIRPSDEIFRKGGDEFVIMFRNLDKKAAANLILRLNEGFRNHQKILELVNSYQRPITISMGICPYKPNNQIPLWTVRDREILNSTIMDLADKALYKAKELGKNQIFVSDEITEIEYINHG